MTARASGHRGGSGRRRSPASATANWWARIYTAGIDAELRQRRRDEIASDTWEHLHSAASPLWAELSLAGRVVRGIASDIAWRLHWKGAPEMRTNAKVERIAGVAALLLVGLVIAALASEGGVDTRREYFAESFTDASGETNAMAVAAASIIAAGVALIVLGIALAMALWKPARWAAIALCAVLAPAGLLLVIGGALSIAVRELAQAWGESASNDLVLFEPARSVAKAREVTLGFASIGVIGGFLVLGAAVLKTGVLPRWIGWLAAVGTVTALVGVAAIPFGHDEVLWGFWMASFGLAGVFFVVVALSLIVRGVRLPAGREGVPPSLSA